MNGQNTQVRRTRYLINRGFQLRYMGIFVLASFLAALIIGGVLFYIVEMNWMVQLDRGLQLFPEVKELLVHERNWILMSFGFVFVILAVMLSFFGLFLSHRVAGPVFALGRRMSRIVEQKDLITPLGFRKLDALQEVKDFFNQTLEHLRQNIKGEAHEWEMMSLKITQLQTQVPSFQMELKNILEKIDILKKDKQEWLALKHS